MIAVCTVHSPKCLILSSRLMFRCGWPFCAAQPAVATSGIWGGITAAVRMKRFLWIEDLIALVEQGAAPQRLNRNRWSPCAAESAQFASNRFFSLVQSCCEKYCQRLFNICLYRVARTCTGPGNGPGGEYDFLRAQRESGWLSLPNVQTIQQERTAMSELLFEIGTEEIPAGYIQPALDALAADAARKTAIFGAHL
jgi:hypothetical protein